MDKNEIAEIIENFAPLELQEKWDCSGWLVNTDKKYVKKILICLTVTDDILRQAKENGCGMIVSHHPLFFVPLEYKNIDIYCAHTNMDRTVGGTTDSLIKLLGYEPKIEDENTFVRYVDTTITVKEFGQKLCEVSDNVRVVNNCNFDSIHKIGFCAGSGAEFLNEAKENGADAFVTGDLKFHSAVESEIVVFDIGHFESEIPVLNTFKKLLASSVVSVIAQEKSPFVTLK